MNSINDRFKELRIACKKSQDEWGKILGISKSGISDIENGRRNVTDQHLIMLGNWAEFPVNIEYLRTGTGEMFRQLSRSEVIADFAGKLMKDEEDSFRRRLIEALAELDEKEWEVLAGIATKIVKNKGQA